MQTLKKHTNKFKLELPTFLDLFGHLRPKPMSKANTPILADRFYTGWPIPIVDHLCKLLQKVLQKESPAKFSERSDVL